MYGKLFAQTFTGSMVGRGSTVFAVWSYVVANAKPPGVVELNPSILAAQIGTTKDDVDNAIEYLCSPDPQSRTQDHEGRRLLREGQFLYAVPNHTRYRGLRDEEDRREQDRVRKQRQRERERFEHPDPPSTGAAAPAHSAGAGVPAGGAATTPSPSQSASTNTSAGDDRPGPARPEAGAPSARQSSVPGGAAPANGKQVTIPDWLDDSLFAKWWATRPAKARTNHAKEAAIEKLDKMRGGGADPNEVVRTSLANGWQGLFPPDRFGPKGGGATSAHAAVKRFAES